MRIPEADIENIKSRVDIVDVISKYISVIPKGKNYVSLCPFHNDTNPSMTISKEKQIYKCFSCGEGGNVFTFVQEYEKVPYPKAVSIVADFIGYDLSSYQDKNIVVDEKKEHLYNLIKNASEFYNFCLENEEGEAGKKYFVDRNIDEQVISKFKLGFAPTDSTKILMFLTRKGYSVEQIVEAGIGVIDGGTFRDRFNGRVVFTLTDLNGRVVGFSGRKIDNRDAAKYVNSNENVLFKKSQCLYNYYEARSPIRNNKRVYIVEGFMDVIALYKAGIENVVATMGTALSRQHVAALVSLNVDIVLSLDGDAAGQTATSKIVENLKSQKAKVLITKTTDKAKDFDELLNSEGKDKVIEAINDTYSIYEFIFYYLLKNVNLNNYSDKAKFVRDFTSIIKNEIKDRIEIDYFVGLMSKNLGYSKELIFQNIDKTGKKVVESYIGNSKVKNKHQDRYYNAEIQIIVQMLNSVEAVQYYISNLGYLHDITNKRIATYICGCYQKNKRVLVEEIIGEMENEKETDLILKIKQILSNKELPKTFDKNIFDVIIKQKPIQNEIDELEVTLKNASTLDEKTRLTQESVRKKTKLRKLSSQFVVEKEDD